MLYIIYNSDKYMIRPISNNGYHDIRCRDFLLTNLVIIRLTFFPFPTPFLFLSPSFPFFFSFFSPLFFSIFFLFSFSFFPLFPPSFFVFSFFSPQFPFFFQYFTMAKRGPAGSPEARGPRPVHFVLIGEAGTG